MINMLCIFQYVNEKAEGRNRFGKFDDDIYKGEKLD